MNEPTTYEIVIRGRATERILRPLADDFEISHPGNGQTHLVGTIRDAAHLYGVLAHLTSIAAEIIAVRPTEIANPNHTERQEQ